MDPIAEQDRCITLVVAACDEAEALPVLWPRLRAALDMAERDGLVATLLFVDDGSRDGTWSLLQSFAREDARVALLRLSRNFGKEAALTAGLDQVTCGAALILDADGQDPPELLPQFVARWREGYDDVRGVRIAREGESWFKRVSAHLFYRLMGRLSATPVPRDTGDFRLLSPRALAALRQLRERQRFMKGLFGWIGFRAIEVPYQRAPRLGGRSKFSVWRLWNFALQGLTSFSTVPLRVATYVGLATALLAFGFGAWVVVRALLWGDRVAGWPSLMAVILLLGGVQLMALGMIGEYLGRLYEEAKQRPLYLVDTWQPAMGVSSRQQRFGPQGDDHAYGTTAVGRQTP
ncbi:glycosyltransferase family 2 protein [Thermomonas hydrothermalis]|uniref:Glycosyltransferase involved in cell wall bisynthesis n=1 Tax=Thermomonas hydrothermalis TaxID=213588 RepID=A0A1M4VXH5_9GAMM|nr:glycosyltransferase family 2 protein [Thermomonas hydrothermalis]SHE73563.1 Glycosyltransferase involved in cell wall bisynthesis [Thermomonas hydrothermalis]